MDNPKSEISVVIPTYNRAELLRAALDSVLAQTVLPKEIVIVDDGSTDHTAKVVARAEERAKRNGDRPSVVYLRGPHANRRGEARNRGADATTAPLIAFLDSDDLWKPERIERQLEVLARAPDGGFAFCNVQRFDENGPVGEICLPPNRDFNGYILGDILDEPRAISSTLIVRREAFEHVGKFREMRANEDYELTLRLAAEYKASYVPEVLVLMREHGGRTSRIQREMPLLDSLHIIEEFLEQRPNLLPDIKARGRKTLANIHLKLARISLESGDHRVARRHLWAMLRLRPWDRRVLPTYVRSWLTPGKAV
jgi:glycosyltransferase involved in cell wall biosynthesis